MDLAKNSFKMSKASSRVGKAIDWEKLNKVVTSAEGKSKLQALRRAYDDVAGIIQERFTIVCIFKNISWFFFQFLVQELLTIS